MSSIWNVDQLPTPVGSDQVEVRVTSLENTLDVYSYGMQVVDGEPYEPYCTADRWNRLNKQMKYKQGDIVITSYPKCGTTWMEQIVLLLLNHGKKEAMNPATKNTFQAQTNGAIGKIWLEAAIEQDPEVQTKMGKQAVPVSWEEFDSMSVPNRVMKTHANPACLLGTNHQGLANIPDGVKVIIVTRNPFDACVSSYFYGFNAYRRGWPFAAWASLWLQGSLSMGDWFTWTQQWHAQHTTYGEKEAKSLWVSYEALLQHPKQEITRIVHFLAPQTDTTEAVVDQIIALSSFASMKTQAKEWLAGEPTAHVDQHLRKGECGDWRNYFARQGALYAGFVAKYHTVLATTGLRYQLTIPSDNKEEEEVEWLQ